MFAFELRGNNNNNSENILPGWNAFLQSREAWTDKTAFVSWTSIYPKKVLHSFTKVFLQGLWKSAERWHAKSTFDKGSRLALLTYRKTLVTYRLQITSKIFSCKSFTSTHSNWQVENKNKNACNLKIITLLNVTKGCSMQNHKAAVT